MNNIITIVQSVIFYLYLGWCWADIMCYFNESNRTKKLFRIKYLVTLLLWPISLMQFDAWISENKDE